MNFKNIFFIAFLLTGLNASSYSDDSDLESHESDSEETRTNKKNSKVLIFDIENLKNKIKKKEKELGENLRGLKEKKARKSVALQDTPKKRDLKAAQKIDEEAKHRHDDSPSKKMRDQQKEDKKPLYFSINGMGECPSDYIRIKSSKDTKLSEVMIEVESMTMGTEEFNLQGGKRIYFIFGTPYCKEYLDPKKINQDPFYSERLKNLKDFVNNLKDSKKLDSVEEMSFTFESYNCSLKMHDISRFLTPNVKKISLHLSSSILDRNSYLGDTGELRTENRSEFLKIVDANPNIEEVSFLNIPGRITSNMDREIGCLKFDTERDSRKVLITTFDRVDY